MSYAVKLALVMAVAASTYVVALAFSIELGIEFYVLPVIAAPFDGVAAILRSGGAS
jgi:hypothetical protein